MALSDTKQLVQNGEYSETLARVKDQVRKEPGDVASRLALFELFALGGEWDRGLTQLEAVAKLSPTSVPLGYGSATRASAHRAECLTTGRMPRVLGVEEVPADLRQQWEAIVALEQGDAGPLTGLIESDAIELAGGGRINGTGCEDIVGLDSRFPNVFEYVWDDEYCWLPFRLLRSIQFPAQIECLRDMVWMPVRSLLVSGDALPGFVFVRTPGTEKAPSEKAILGQEIVWREEFGDLNIGYGPHALYADEEVKPFNTLKLVEFLGEEA